MENQDQYNEEAEINQSAESAEFSTTRRAVTAILVLMAALLLGYILSTVMFSPDDSQIEAPAQPELTAEEKALLRLEAFRVEPTATPTAETIERAQAFLERETAEPTPEQLDRLERFDTGS